MCSFSSCSLSNLLLTDFPFLVPNTNANQWTGFMQVCERDFYVTIVDLSSENNKSENNSNSNHTNNNNTYNNEVKTDGSDKSDRKQISFGSGLRLLFPVAETLSVPTRPSHVGAADLCDQFRSNYFLYCEDDLFQLLSGAEVMLQQRLSQSRHIHSFMSELKDIIVRCMRSSFSSVPSSVPVANVKFYSQLLHDLSVIGWDRLVSIDNTFTLLQIKISDESQRDHIVALTIPDNYPLSCPNISVDLPCAVVSCITETTSNEIRNNNNNNNNNNSNKNHNSVFISWLPPNRNLLNIVNVCKQLIISYSDLYDCLDDIDRECWILEENKSRSVLTRRIVIGKGSSIEITLNSRSPRSLCQVRWLGQEAIVQQYRIRFANNVQQWNSSLVPRLNLSNLMECEFPSPSTIKDKSEYNQECAICYSYKLEQTIPDRVCDNVSCGRSYHYVCLHEWFSSLSSTRNSFNMMFSSCPYCTAQMALPVSSG